MQGLPSDWLPSIAMGNSPLSLHHHLLPIIGRRGPCVLGGGGFFSQERCVTLALHPRPWGLAPFQGCTVPPHWLHLVRFFCSAASPHLGPPLSRLRISRALEILRWKAPAQQLGRKKASRHPAHLTRFQESGLEFCSFLWSLFTWVYSLSPGAGGSLLPRVGELVCVCCSTSLPTLFFLSRVDGLFSFTFQGRYLRMCGGGGRGARPSALLSLESIMSQIW